MNPNDQKVVEDDSQPSITAMTRRIQRLSLHLTPLPALQPSPDQLDMLTCSSKAHKLEVDKGALSSYMRGKHRDIQDQIFEFFNSRPDLQTPVEISMKEHRELCMRQLTALVREAKIKPFRYVAEDPAKYFAITEAVGGIDVSFGIKLGVHFR